MSVKDADGRWAQTVWDFLRWRRQEEAEEEAEEEAAAVERWEDEGGALSPGRAEELEVFYGPVITAFAEPLRPADVDDRWALPGLTGCPIHGAGREEACATCRALAARPGGVDGGERPRDVPPSV